MKKMTKEDFSSYTVTLPDYINQDVDNLVKLPYASTNTIPYMTKFVGTLNDNMITTMQVTPSYTDGSCGTVTNFGNVALAPVYLNIQKGSSMIKLCKDDLNDTFMTKYYQSPSNDENVAGLNTEITAELLAQIGVDIDKAIWVGNKTSSTGTTILGIEGLIYQCSSTTHAYTAISGATTISNVIDIVDGMINTKPASLIGKETFLFLGTLDFQLYINAINKADLFHVFVDEKGVSNYNATEMTYRIPGTFTTLKGVLSLNSTNKMILTTKENLRYGLSQNIMDGNLFSKYDELTKYFYIVYDFAFGVKCISNDYVVMKKS